MNENAHTELLSDILGVLGVIYKEMQDSKKSSNDGGKDDKKSSGASKDVAHIITSLSSIDVLKKAKSTKEVNSVVLCITALVDASNKLSSEGVNNMKNFVKIFDSKKIGEGISSLIEALGNKDVTSAIANTGAITAMLNVCAEINAKTSKDLKKNLPVISDSLSKLIDSIAKLPVKPARINTKSLTELFQFIADISAWTALKIAIFGPRIAKSLGRVLEGIGKLDTAPAEIKIKWLIDLLSFCTSLDKEKSKNLERSLKALSKSMKSGFDDFMKVVSAAAKNFDLDKPDGAGKFLVSLGLFIKELADISKRQAKNLSKSLRLIGDALAKFIDTLNGIDFKDTEVRIEGIKELVNSVSKMMILLAGLAIVMVAVGALADMESIGKGLLVYALVVGAGIGIYYALSKIDAAKIKGTEKVIDAFIKLYVTLSATAIAMVMIGEIVDWESLGKAGLIYGAIVYSAYILYKKINELSGEKSKGIQEKIDALTKLYLTLTATAVAMIAIGAATDFKALGKAALIYFTLVLSAYFLYKELNNLPSGEKHKGIQEKIDALTKLYLTLTITAVAMIIIGAVASEKILEKAAGIYLTILVTAMLVYYILTKIDTKKQADASNTIKSMTLLFAALTGIAVVAVIIAAVVDWETLVKAAAIYAFIIVSAMAMIWILASELFGKEKVKGAMGTVKSVTLLLGVLTVLAITAVLIAAFTDWETLGKAAMIYAAVIFSAWFIMKTLAKMSKDIDGKGKDIFFMLAGVAIVLLSCGILAYIMADLGSRDGIVENFFIGFALVATVIFAAGLLLHYLISESKKLDKEGGIKKAYASLGIFAGAIAIIWWSTKVGLSIIDLGEKMDSVSTILKGAGLVAAVIGGAIIIIKALKAIPKSAMKDIAIGVLVLGAVVGLLYLITKVMNPFLDLCLKAETVEWKVIGNTGLKIVAVLGALGLIATGIGALVMNPFVAIALGIGIAAILGLTAAMFPLIKMIDKYLDVVKKIKTINTADFSKAEEIIYSSSKSKPSIVGSMINIVKSITDATPGLWTMIKAMVLIDLMKAMMDPIQKFVDIISKLATKKLFVGFDKDKNPIYHEFTLEDFSTAADVITRSFTEFIKTLSAGMKDVSISSAFAIKLLAGSMKPLMESITPFVEAIQKMINGFYVDHFDEEGKPVYSKKRITMDDYIAAGNTISTLFINFITGLTEGLKDVTPMSAYAVRLITNALGPVFASIGDFTNLLALFMDPTKMYKVESYNDKGLPVYSNEKVDGITAANTIVSVFRIFITGLVSVLTKDDYNYKKAKKNAAHVVKMTKTLAEAIDPITQMYDKLTAKKITIDGIKTNVSDVIISLIKDLASIANYEDEIEDATDALKLIASGSEGGWFSSGSESMMKYLTSYTNSIVKIVESIKKQGESKGLYGAVQNIVNSINHLAKISFPETAAEQARTATTVAAAADKIVKANNKVVSAFISVEKSQNKALKSLKNIDSYLKKSASDRKKTLSEMAESFEKLAEKISDMSESVRTLKADMKELNNLKLDLGNGAKADVRVENNNDTRSPLGRIVDGIADRFTNSGNKDNDDYNRTTIIVEFKDTTLKGYLIKP